MKTSPEISIIVPVRDEAANLDALIQAGDLASVPVEPFGGAYRLDFEHRTVVSTTQPNRLRLHHAPDGSITSLR